MTLSFLQILILLEEFIVFLIAFYNVTIITLQLYSGSKKNGTQRKVSNRMEILKSKFKVC